MSYVFLESSGELIEWLVTVYVLIDNWSSTGNRVAPDYQEGISVYAKTGLLILFLVESGQGGGAKDILNLFGG